MTAMLKFMLVEREIDRAITLELQETKAIFNYMRKRTHLSNLNSSIFFI